MINNDVVHLKSVELPLPRGPLAAWDERGQLLIDIRLTGIEPLKLISRLNAEKIELYCSERGCLVSLKWVRASFPGHPFPDQLREASERFIKYSFACLPNVVLPYTPLTEVKPYDDSTE